MTDSPPHNTPLSKISTGTQSTWRSTSSSESSSASRYALDAEDEAPILVFSLQYGVAGIEKTSQKALCSKLDNGPSTPQADHLCASVTSGLRSLTSSTEIRRPLRVTKKDIPRGTSYIDVRRHDLYMPYEKEQFSEYPNYDSWLAEIKVPSSVWWNRYLLGGYDKLYIVSPELSPASTPTDDGRS